MPNGGSDCCGTCWFNSTNEGQARIQKVAMEAEVRCVIRDVPLEEPFWTYCANHPHHNPDKIELPIGPVYEDDGEGFPYGRRALFDSPDTEEIRLKLLGLLRAIRETPHDEYPTETKLDETAIYQLGLFKERRSVDELRRILAFNPFATPTGENSFKRNRIPTLTYALEALARIIGDGALVEIKRAILLGREEAEKQEAYSDANDRLAVVRYYGLKALDFLSDEKAKKLSQLAIDDPNQEVAELAKQLQTK